MSIDLPSVARQLFESAEQDLRAAEILSSASGIGDAVVGFHAQQAVEKALKSVLAHRSVGYRRTHDIAELLDRIEDEGIEKPSRAERLDELNPYGVAARYGVALSAGLDREFAVAAVRDVLTWASGILRRGTRD